MMCRIALVLFGAAGVWGATVPQGFTDAPVAPGVITTATAFDFAPDGRIFVCQQTGEVRVIKNGALLATPFHTFTTDPNGERGLLGITFDPSFGVSNQYVYFYYTVPATPPFNRVVRVMADGDVSVANSETFLFPLNNLSSATNHNGGAIHFGVDGKLYVGVGENAIAANAQTLNNLLGKILRINSDGTIPTGNPFYATATGSNRAIWTLGLRNPFTFAIQPQSGRIIINDVGQNSFEEVNDGIAGSNYGWPASEGFTADPNHRSPLYYYSHGSSATQGFAIAGGTFYNPDVLQFPGTYLGKYFFADFTNDWIRQLDLTTNTPSGFATGANAPVDLKTGPDGALYYLSRGAGMVMRVSYTGTLRQDKIGSFLGGYWLLDRNGNSRWDGPATDGFHFFSLGYVDEIPVTGDWNGSGTAKIGIYRQGTWMLDYNGNGLWDGPGTDRLVFLGGPGFTPVTGDWSGSGSTKIGAFRDGAWILDLNGNFAWDGTITDRYFHLGGVGHTPMVGDWNGSGTEKPATYFNGTWLIDLNGNFAWDGPVTDRLVFFGGPGYTPIRGDWNGSGSAKIGAYANGTWLLDYNGNFAWDGIGTDRNLFFGNSGYLAMPARYAGVTAHQLGAQRNGTWQADRNGNLTWDLPSDALTFFGNTGNVPLTGRW